MANNRRRGKSVVFDSLPSLVTTDDASMGFVRNKGQLSEKLSREAIREIVMVLVGLILVVWLFFGGSGGPPAGRDTITLGNRQLLSSDTPFIVPAHFGSSSSARDAAKKAPGDKNTVSADPSGSKRASNVIYQYAGANSPDLVLITLIDDTKHPRDYIDKIIENRIEYAQIHGYGVLVKFVSDFTKFIEDSHNHQSSWARVALAQEAQVSFPKAEWIWYLDGNSILMQSDVDIATEVLLPEALEPLMERQVPIMRKVNTHIRTYRNNMVNDVSYVLTRDGESLNTDSFIFKNSAASRIWLELWGEPLYRTFPRFNDERDALGHMMQWHTQFLVRTAVIKSRYLASPVINDYIDAEVWGEIGYKDGDMAAIVSCDFTTENCRREFQTKWNERKRPVKETSPPIDGLQAPKNQVQNQVQVQAQAKAQEKAQEKAEKQAEQAAAEKRVA